jgi:hypothetical protein
MYRFMKPISLCTFVLALFVAALFSITAPVNVLAQQQPGNATMNNPTVKEYGRSGYQKITVYVWGNADTGVWRVEQGTDLLEFVSVVSRLQLVDDDPRERKIETLRIYRDQAQDETPFFEQRVETLFSKRGDYPALQDGDILVLETKTKSRFTWRDVAQVTGTIAAVVNTYLLLDRLGDE